MESLRQKWNNLPLRSFFMGTVLSSVCLVTALSALIIWGCVSFRHYLVPDADSVYLTIEKRYPNGTASTEMYLLPYGEDPQSIPVLISSENDILIDDTESEIMYSIQKVEQSVAMLTPKRKLAYQACGIIMVAAPAVLSFAGILLCSVYFYRRKLEQPIRLLSGATREIAEQNLDFSITYDCGDELGDLCRSFDQMRSTLLENNKAMWEMLEERRLLQTAVAHDLRNPIAIIQGYTEYLEMGLEKGSIDETKALHIARNLSTAAKRLEHYTESVRTLNRFEDMELCKDEISLSKLASEITEDFDLLCTRSGIALRLTDRLPDSSARVDAMLLYRILENLVGNALRYAQKEIHLEFVLCGSAPTGQSLSVTVTDDGAGFPPEILRQKRSPFTIHGKDGHMGIGLAVSALLCQKHGGSLELSNPPEGGASAKITLAV